MNGTNSPGFEGELRVVELEKTKVQMMTPAPKTKAVARDLDTPKLNALSARLNLRVEDDFCAKKLRGEPCRLTERQCGVGCLGGCLTNLCICL